ncbi:rab-GTPase-TBC domain-containing protein [Catenaria anguillulae PL171]|uniref:Rab-GTPase-TBC domain-containing protein n=1 Tax=Catenaria anguillulae PL171 TaxID=765915 RepID=A0A1Y2I0Q0_9FUNG|nr:rab-GTPase-TBC domain-containing protein [Catenaria anguillulae PL171]
MATYRERVALFEHVLSAKSGVVDFERLRRLCFRGIPEAKGIRQRCWKLLLNYLPSDTSKWPTILAAKRQIYQGFVRDFCSVGPSSAPPSLANSPKQASPTEDPLSATSPHPPPSSTGHASQLDRDLLDTIDKDVRRTMPSMAFFHDQVFELPNNPLPPRRVFFQSNEAFDKNFLAVERILYVFAKLNPGIGYIQGMNHDFFIDSMDGDATGINSAMNMLATRLNHLDPELSRSLSSKGLEPAFFSFRWFTCLCAQEFHIPDLLRLWDSVFADRVAARNRGRNEAADLRRAINPTSPTTLSMPTPPQSIQRTNSDPVTASLLIDAGAWTTFSSATEDDSVHPTRHGQFLPDFMAAMVLHQRQPLVKLAFDEGLLLLQQPPAAELDYLLRETYHLVLIGDPEPPKANDEAGEEEGTGPGGAVNAWVAAAMKRAGLDRKPSVESLGHGRSRSLGVWSWSIGGGGGGDTGGPVVGSAAAAPTGSEQQPQQQAEDSSGTTAARRLMHRQSASFSAMGGMVWGKLKNLRSTSPEPVARIVKTTAPTTAVAANEAAASSTTSLS